MIDASAVGVVALKFGESGANEPITGGVIIFGITAVALYYLAYVRTEMNAGFVLRMAPFFMLLLAVVAATWPWRPWPH